MRRLPPAPPERAPDTRDLTASEARMLACATMPLDTLRQQAQAEVHDAWALLRRLGIRSQVP
ncbi:MAG: hypothetical protein ACK5YV_07970 [Betaproteobacteria bacterium]|jgi:hypothetical protein